jgi:hypothetical protein
MADINLRQNIQQSGATSANTETILCVDDCNNGKTTISPPHAVYTNNYGQSIVQFNTVALGGPNGLNS